MSIKQLGLRNITSGAVTNVDVACAGGYTLVVFKETGNLNVKKYDGSWSYLGQNQLPLSNIVSDYLRITVDPTNINNVYVCYYNTNTNKCVIMYWNGIIWVEITFASPDNIIPFSICCGPTGILYVLYKKSDDKMAVKQYSSGAWSQFGTDPVSARAWVSLGGSIIYNSTVSKIFVAFQNNHTGDNEIGIFSSSGADWASLTGGGINIQDVGVQLLSSDTTRFYFTYKYIGINLAASMLLTGGPTLIVYSNLPYNTYAANLHIDSSGNFYAIQMADSDASIHILKYLSSFNIWEEMSATEDLLVDNHWSSFLDSSNNSIVIAGENASNGNKASAWIYTQPISLVRPTTIISGSKV